MSIVENGNTVSVHYTGTFDSGEVFDTSKTREKPLTFQVGLNQVIPGFESAIVGMTEGATKSIMITPEEGYGLVSEEAIQTIPRDQFPEDFEFSEGGIIQAQNETGTFQGTIASFTDAEAVIDFNHPLAGKTLNFEIELVEIQTS